ncbi:MAG TPA: chitinase [Stackebrandtia sp.]|jgi:chitinase|uniref:chitinase n=1 Tax=Stackebrandtia sp. TaxID=2023065 RepID=UPI002D7496D7|nr:chitinase [Stackebrandtia sp.]HZE38704.1 chitinase [Stackebrandtia sp.]
MLPKRLAIIAPALAVGLAVAATTLPAAADDAPPSHHQSTEAADFPVAPYIDITRDTPKLTDVASATGQKTFTLAFILGSAAGCAPAWGGTIDLNDASVIDQVKALHDAGGDVVVSSGGAAGPYLENSCSSADDLYGAYTKVLDATGSNHLDVDVEASIPTAMVNTALKRLQDDRGTTISYTLRVQGQDYGIDPSSVSILQDAASQGLDVSVNPMVMDFGYTGDWGQAMIDAAQATLGQMKQIWPDYSDDQLAAHLGVTPMIGDNDSGMVTTQDNARSLLSWARSKHIGYIRFWSIGRDNGGCAAGGVRPDCSGIAQSDYEFTSIFQGFAG